MTDDAAETPTPETDDAPAGVDEVLDVARAIATAVSPDEGMTDVQASLLRAITSALTGIEVDYQSLEPLGAEDLAICLEGRDDEYRQRIVHHMVLGELVLRPLPTEVGLRVQEYASALGVQDRFVRVARRYAQGAYGLAWKDLRRSGFTERWEQVHMDQLRAEVEVEDPFHAPDEDPELAAAWRCFEEHDEGTLGEAVWRMYTGRGFALPGTRHGAPAYLAQHDFVHVLADYGTNLQGELEVFAFIGRADPDPKGFAWLATVIGLFETGYIADAGFFQSDISDRGVQVPGMADRVADALRRGKVVSQVSGRDLFEIDYHALAHLPVGDVRTRLGVPDKSDAAKRAKSPGLFDRAGMSEIQKRVADRNLRRS
jgi:hypothetical protein